MNSINKAKIFVIDTSVVLSGKPINLGDVKLVTTNSISKELKPGGRDYRAFQFLLDKGLTIMSPSRKSIEKIDNVSKETGDINRLSNADREIIALAYDLKKEAEDVVILTDDYSIQNVADALKIQFESFSQKGITKSFKWTYKCKGCGKKFKDNIKICSICGAKIRNIISEEKDIR